MNIKEYLFSALQSLRGNLMRTILTMLGIVIGIASVILIVALGRGASASITNQLSSFGTDFFTVIAGNISDGSAFTGSVKTLTIDDGDALLKSPVLSNIKHVVPAVMGSEIIIANNETDRLTRFGVTEEFFQIFSPLLQSGRFLTRDDITASSKVAVIGVDSIKTFFGENYDPVGETIRVDGRPVRIVGVMKIDSSLASTFNKALLMPLSFVQKQMLGIDYVHRFMISVKNPDVINQTMVDSEALLRDRHRLGADEKSDFSIESFKDVQKTLETVTSLLTTLVAAISAISLLVGGIGIMNIMLVTVTERTREIGLLKAIGAKERDILTQFLIESIVLTLSGGIIGISLGIAAAFGITRLVNIPFVLSIGSVLLAVSVSTVVGIIFGIYPARRAARLNPIDALRHE
jgi:putative ABC transport system permease protein